MSGCSRCPHCTEVIVNWMGKRGYATGHGDTVEDLLNEIDGHAKATLKVENERLRAAWLKRIKIENVCRSFEYDHPCRWTKCACVLEMQSYVDEQTVGDRK